MSTAVFITGQARTFSHCFKSQREAVFRRLDRPHFFVSLQKEPGGGEMVVHDLLRNEYGSERLSFEAIDQPAFPEELRARFEEASIHAPWYRSVPVEGIWKQFWALARGWDFAIECGWPGGAPDRFVRIRPDLHFHNWAPPRVQTEVAEVAGFKGRREASGVHAPWWGSWGGCPDRFAYIVGHAAAQQYFNVYHRINELLAEGCGYHPETMLARALERAGVRVHQTMDAEFTTIRAKGDKRPHDVPSYQSRDVFNLINARLAEEGRG